MIHVHVEVVKNISTVTEKNNPTSVYIAAK